MPVRTLIGVGSKNIMMSNNELNKIKFVKGYPQYNGLLLEDAEIIEAGELIREKYREFQAEQKTRN